jgi:hypothetical protein
MRHRVRLRVRLAKALDTSDVMLSQTVAGREVTIASQALNQPLSEALWIILSARGFLSEEEARSFGEQLCTITELAGLCSRLGIDLGVGKPTMWMSEDLARSVGLILPHQSLLPNVHGLAIVPDDDSIRFPSVQVEAKVRALPDHFVGALVELGAALPVQLPKSAEGVRILNLALINPEPLAQIALSLSCVEALGQNENWTEAQAELIDELATQVETSASEQDAERLEVAKALRRSFQRIGLRQGVLRVLDRLNLRQLQKEWDRIYGLRSGLFHGTVRLSEPEIAELAVASISLCGRVILALAATERVRLPSISRE